MVVNCLHYRQDPHHQPETIQTKMTEHIREMSSRSREALPKNKYELAAYAIRWLGPVVIFLPFAWIILQNSEKRSDRTVDMVEANVAAFKQVSADLQTQRDTLSEIRSDIRDLRHPSTVQNNPTTAH